ncbi:hypothetical protein H4582DRAFT_2080407 [Lactarius indigo]|nr:hypothetical protein H4582DRAFT_2080407 [Lactarius indigo]
MSSIARCSASCGFSSACEPSRHTSAARCGTHTARIVPSAFGTNLVNPPTSSTPPDPTTEEMAASTETRTGWTSASQKFETAIAESSVCAVMWASSAIVETVMGYRWQTVGTFRRLSVD